MSHPVSLDKGESVAISFAIPTNIPVSAVLALGCLGIRLGLGQSLAICPAYRLQLKHLIPLKGTEGS